MAVVSPIASLHVALILPQLDTDTHLSVAAIAALPTDRRIELSNSFSVLIVLFIFLPLST
jgi:hypothetical protein